MEKMLVTQALNELKTISNRIDRAINNAMFITASKTVDKNAAPGMTKEDFKTNAIASMQSIKDLIDRREKIKAGIIASNAVTEVEIAGEKMTVAKAIDTKDSIKYKRTLLDTMKCQYANAVTMVNKATITVDDNINKLITAAYGKEGKEKVSEADYDAIAKPYKIANEVSLVDPLSLKEEIDKLEEYIENFTANVDAQLQISNCVTWIEI